MPSTFKDRKHLIRTDYRDGRLVAYTIAFYRPDGEWYDQVTYDSHERKKGRLVAAPHFHLKVKSAFKKDADRAVAEIRTIIENELPLIAEISGRLYREDET
jgi:hypothetical protein